MHSWHSLTPAVIVKQLTASKSGLSAVEAQARLKQYGENTVHSAPTLSASRRFLRQFHNVLVYLLLAAAIVTCALQHWIDTTVILSVVLINALIGFIQEAKAEESLAAIRALLSPTANVLRDNEQLQIPASQVVPGDIVLLSAGDKVPADVRLISTYSLRVQEAILTGESLDVEKSLAIVAEDTPLGSRICMAYSGTLITAGQGKGIAVTTGQNTEIGRISTMLGSVKSPETPLTQKLARFSQRLAAFIVLLSLSVFFFGIYVRHLPVNDMFMVAIGIAVSAIPEGLPAVISITMALGVRAMARRNAIVRHLPVIETLGNVTIICTDKTGTLTKNELAVTDIITAKESFCVTGTGYSPEGKILFDNKEIELTAYPTFGDIGSAAILNNDATLKLHKGIWELNGDPTEGALMAFASKAGHDEQTLEAWPRSDVIPFSAESRYMATLHHDALGNGMIYVKGAPERILGMCNSQQRSNGTDEPLDVDYWQGRVEYLARQGKRVLAIAYRHTIQTHRKLQHEDIQKNLILLGLFGIMDTPRDEAREAIATCLDAGITVKMITGDHALTASSIGGLLGIPNHQQVITGMEIEHLSDQALAQLVGQVHIYARMHPEHKLRLVQALQATKAVVAMTGDGVNDAPALKTADVGISMGKQGTEVAKEASALVLADDNFASIAHAVEEGRNIYRNIKRTIQFMLVTDGAEGLTLLIALFAGFTLPITPLQILWVNMITAVTLSLAFAFAPHDATVMRSKPLPPGTALFSRRTACLMIMHILLIAGGTTGLFLYELHKTASIELARTLAVNALVFFQIYYLWSLFPLRKKISALMPVILATAGVLLLQLAFTYITWMQGVFATASMNLAAWLTIASATSCIFLWMWIEKTISRKRHF